MGNVRIPCIISSNLEPDCEEDDVFSEDASSVEVVFFRIDSVAPLYIHDEVLNVAKVFGCQIASGSNTYMTRLTQENVVQLIENSNL